MNNKSLPEYIVMNPGAEVSEENRAWQGVPGIARTKGGRLFAAWMSGGLFEPCLDNYSILIKSDDNGNSWSKPIMAVYGDMKNMYRNIDMQLWVDERNRLWVMWTKSPIDGESKKSSIRTPFILNYMTEFHGVEAMICNDPDGDELVFEAPRRICGGFIRNKPIIRHNGDYIFPAYDWVHDDRYILRVSKDGGETFSDLLAAAKPQNKSFDETMVYEADSRICMMARTDLGYYLESHSDDDGKTWSEPCEYQKAPCSRFFIGRLSGGQLVYVRNISDTERQGLKVCLSEDDGETWPCELVIDIRDNVSYPDLSEGENGELYIIYDRERNNNIKLNKETWHSDAAKEILLAKITVEDVYNGSLGENSFTARVVSKAKIDFVER